ncbi:hypothetical protein LCGC14_2708000, partial [marine sediment metagenome]
AYVDVRYRPVYTQEQVEGPITFGAVVRDLTDATVTVTARMSGGLVGSRNAPNGMQVFLKSHEQASDTWSSLYGTWRNGTGRWQQLVLDLSGPLPPLDGHMDPGFDASSIALIGFKIGTNASTAGRFRGQLDIAGVHVDFADGTSWDWTFENLDGSIKQMRETGANAVAVVDTWYVDSPAGAEIAPHERKTQQFPGSAPAVEQTVTRLHAEGMAAVLKPHIDVLDDSWRGHIRPAPEDIPAFFESYKAFIGFYAEIAERTHAEGLVVEAELESLATDPSLRPYWEDVIASVRAAYSGELLLAANWNNAPDNEGFQKLQIADLVDRVGINVYVPSSGGANPTVADIAESLGNWLPEVRSWYQAVGKPYCFTELGIPSMRGAASAPWRQPPSGEIVYFDPVVQVSYYEAALNVFGAEPGFSGLFGWHFRTWSDAGVP